MTNKQKGFLMMIPFLLSCIGIMIFLLSLMPLKETAETFGFLFLTITILGLFIAGIEKFNDD